MPVLLDPGRRHSGRKAWPAMCCGSGEGGVTGRAVRWGLQSTRMSAHTYRKARSEREIESRGALSCSQVCH